MLLYAVIAALVLTAVAVALPLLRRSSHVDEVDRFHVARSLTTTWATVPQEPMRVPASGQTDDDEPQG